MSDAFLEIIGPQDEQRKGLLGKHIGRWIRYGFTLRDHQNRFVSDSGSVIIAIKSDRFRPLKSYKDLFKLRSKFTFLESFEVRTSDFKGDPPWTNFHFNSRFVYFENTHYYARLGFVSSSGELLEFPTMMSNSDQRLWQPIIEFYGGY